VNIEKEDHSAMQKICPFMSYAMNQVPCLREQCAVWDAREEACAMVGGPVRITDALRDVVDTMNDIKVKF
jgi:hypothetical protein